METRIRNLKLEMGESFEFLVSSSATIDLASGQGEQQ